MPLDEFSEAVKSGVRHRRNGQAFEMTADILGQFRHRLITPFRLLAQRF